MNTYKKYCPNVFIAKCETEHNKGDVIIVTTKYGKENEHIVHNLIGSNNGSFFYSITRLDGYDSRERAKSKSEKLNSYANSAQQRSDDWREKSNEGKEFLVLAEPIKIGHHSEKRHRALIERNWNRMSNAMEELKKVGVYEERAKYWDSLVDKINLSMPESLEFFKDQLEEATLYHKGLKNGSIERRHSYSLTYAKKKVNELKKKVETATKLWA